VSEHVHRLSEIVGGGPVRVDGVAHCQVAVTTGHGAGD